MMCMKISSDHILGLNFENKFRMMRKFEKVVDELLVDYGSFITSFHNLNQHQDHSTILHHPP